jgi:hypothetical protein
MDIYSTQPRLARKRPRIERKNDMDPMAKNGGSARMRSVSVEVNDQKLLSPNFKAVGELQPPADYDFTESTKDNNCATADMQNRAKHFHENESMLASSCLAELKGVKKDVACAVHPYTAVMPRR